MTIFNTVHFLEIVLDLGGCKKTPGGMSGGVSVCVRAVCKLTMQTIWNFLIKRKSEAVSLSSRLALHCNQRADIITMHTSLSWQRVEERLAASLLFYKKHCGENPKLFA